MKPTVDQYRSWTHKSITLMGMSGVGKTRLSSMLRRHHWFHYSVDYRIGTRYLDEAILDQVKKQAMQVPFLRDLLRSDSVEIRNNITVDNLAPLSTFLGKLGDPERGGLPLPEFVRRQRLHRAAEIAALGDVPEFMGKAREIYGYDHFINDVGGSLCELEDDQTYGLLSEHTLFLYIRASADDEQALMERASRDPKPLYYRDTFLDEQLETYMSEHNLEYVALIDPDDFTRWVFPRLFRARIPRYEAIAAQFGYTVSSAEVAALRDEHDFNRLVEAAIERET